MAKEVFCSHTRGGHFIACIRSWCFQSLCLSMGFQSHCIRECNTHPIYSHLKFNITPPPPHPTTRLARWTSRNGMCVDVWPLTERLSCLLIMAFINWKFMASFNNDKRCEVNIKFSVNQKLLCHFKMGEGRTFQNQKGLKIMKISFKLNDVFTQSDFLRTLYL